MTARYPLVLNGTTIQELQASDTLAGVSPTGDTAVTYTAKQTFGGSTSSLAVVLANALERLTISSATAINTINFDIATQSVLYFTTNSTGNFLINARGNSGATLTSLMAIGESTTIVFLNTNGGTAYYPTSFQIDSTTFTVKWSGGTAPSSGDATAINAYTYTIIKTAASSFTILASIAKFA